MKQQLYYQLTCDFLAANVQIILYFRFNHFGDKNFGWLTEIKI